MRNKGFTLLEVLIALVLVSIALTALVQVGANRANTLTELQKKNRAFQIADGQLSWLYLQNLQPGVVDGVEKDNLQNWYWKAEIVSTDNDRILRVDMQVSESAGFEYAQAQLTGFAWR